MCARKFLEADLQDCIQLGFFRFQHANLVDELAVHGLEELNLLGLLVDLGGEVYNLLLLTVTAPVERDARQ